MFYQASFLPILPLVVTPFLPNCLRCFYLFNGPYLVSIPTVSYRGFSAWQSYFKLPPASVFQFAPVGKGGLILFTPGASGQQPLTIPLQVCLLTANIRNFTSIRTSLQKGFCFGWRICKKFKVVTWSRAKILMKQFFL